MLVIAASVAGRWPYFSYPPMVAPTMSIRNEAMSKMIVGLGKDGEKQEAEITPEMIEAGRDVFNEWLDEWDVLGLGYPGGEAVADLIASILASTRAAKPDVLRNVTKR